MPEPLQHIVIVGGGSSGWMSAAALIAQLKDRCKITLIESEEIGTVGVGEATIPPIKLFNQRLDINEAEFMAATQATFKLGIKFDGWRDPTFDYFHPFGTHAVDVDAIGFSQYWMQAYREGKADELDEYAMAWQVAKRNKFSHPGRDRRYADSTFDYAYHFDAGLYALFLRKYCQQRGVIRIEGKVEHVSVSAASGFIDGLQLSCGKKVTGDFFIDCSGFRSLLLGTCLNVSYKDWSHWLPCNSALAVPSASAKPDSLRPYTRSIAHEAGWQWNIPLQHRIGNGHVYCSEYLSDDKAAAILLQNLETEPLAQPRQLRFTTGHREKFWHKNCVAIGLSSGFMEPLESTSLHLVQTAISRFIRLLPNKDCDPLLSNEYNYATLNEFEGIRDFLILHYKANKRPEAFWRDCAAMEIPDSLSERIEHFNKYGNLISHNRLELFVQSNWLAVMAGQLGIPEFPSPVTLFGSEQGIRQTAEFKQAMEIMADRMPAHSEFIAKHCIAALK